MEDTLKFTGEMEHASQSRQDYVEFHAERPIIKKLQDRSALAINIHSSFAII